MSEAKAPTASAAAPAATTPSAAPTVASQKVSVFPPEDGKGVVTDTAAQARRDGGTVDEVLGEESAVDEALEAVADAKKPNKKKLKIKVDNQEIEEELDLDNEEELKKHVQMSKVAQKRMQEAAELRKAQQAMQSDIQSFIEAMRDPDKAAQILSDPRIGLDVKQFAQHILNQEIEDLRKSPEERERDAMKKELERLKKEKEEREALLENERQERVRQQYAQQLEKDIQEALEGSALPKRPYVVKRIVENLAVAMEKGLDDVTVKDVLPYVEKQFREDLKEMFDSYPEETLEQLLGIENVDRLRKHRIRKMKKSAPSSPSKIKEPAMEKAKPEQYEVKRTQSASKFFRNL